jgi:hypothetical protein
MNIRIVTASTLLLFAGVAAAAAEPRLNIPEFKGLSDKASESVVITLDTSLLGMAARFLDETNPEDAAVKEVLTGIKGIYVTSYTFDKPFDYPKNDVDAVRKQLSTPGWSRLMEVRSRKEQSNVDIYISLEDNRANGLAIVASEPLEFTIVNIVGSVDLDKLRKIEGKFGVPKLDLESAEKKPK